LEKVVSLCAELNQFSVENMEEFRAVDAGSISQKENNPYFAEDGEIVDSNKKMGIQQVGGR